MSGSQHFCISSNIGSCFRKKGGSTNTGVAGWSEWIAWPLKSAISFLSHGLRKRFLVNFQRASDSIADEDCSASTWVPPATADNRWSIGLRSSRRCRDYCMVDKAKPVRPCHRYVMWTCLQDFLGLTYGIKIRNYYHLSKYNSVNFTLKQTKTDINGQKPTKTDIALSACIIFA